VYATKEYVDRVERRLYGRETMIKEDLGAIGDTVVEIREGQQRLQTRVNTLDTKVDTLDTKVDTLDTKADTLTTRVDTLDTKVNTLDTKVDTLDTKVDTLTTRVDALDGNLRAVMRHLGVPGAESAGPSRS
jgi:chaperonin cofactor prefoldin